ncbi:MAG: PAS domain S-box protein [Opitutaceae bacterium]
MTITARLTLAMAVLALATAAMVGVLTYRRLEAAILPVELSRLEEHVSGQAALIAEVIAAARHDVQAFTNGAAALEGIIRARGNGGIDPQDGATEQVWRARLARRFVAELEAKRDYVQLRFIGAAEDGREIVRVDRGRAGEEIRIVPEEALQQKGDRDYFAETIKLAKGAIYLSRIDLNVEQGKIEEPHLPVIRIATPVQGANGEPFGIVVLNVDLRPLFARVKRTTPEENRLLIVNAGGFFLLHPRVERTFGFQLGGTDRLQSEYPSLAGNLGRMDRSAGLKEGPDGAVEGVALAPLRLEGGEWIGVIEMAPEASLLATLAPVRQSSVMAGGMVALLAAGLGVWLARSLAKPVVTLTRSVEAFGAGQPLVTTVNATGEIGQLARAFEKMRDEVQEQTSALRHSEELFAKSFQLSPECVLVSRPSDRTVIRANDALCQLWGVTAEDVIGKAAPEFSNWVSEQERLDFLRTLKEKGECLGHETTLKFADGRLRRFAISSRIITFNNEPCILTSMRDVTERKRIEGAAAQLAAIVASSDDAIIGKDLAGVVTSWNVGASKLFGYTAEEMIGQPIMRLIPPERQHEEATILERIRRGESIQPFDTVRQRRDGKFVDVSIAVSAIRDSAGKVIGASKVARDITERMRSASALRTSREEFKDLFANAPVGYHEIDRQGRIVRINKAELEMLGYTEKELLGQFVWKISADPILSERAVFEKFAGISLPPAFERMFRRKDGAAFPVLIKDQLVRDDAGTAIGIRANVQDITERKAVERALQESEEHFRFLNDLGEATRTLSDTEQIMTVVAALLGRHLQVSRCAYADVAADGEKFHIRHDYTDGCVSTVGDYQLSLFGTRAVATLERGQTLVIRDVDAELSPADGADMFRAIGVQAIIVCPLVKEGALRAMMAVHQVTPRDWNETEITIVHDVVERCWATIERRTAEEKIRELNAELEQRVVDRTAQLEAANKELEAFSYSVSHDLRAPLRAVDGFSQAVLDDFGGALPEEGQRYLKTIRGAAQRMGALIDDLLAFSRLSRHPLEKRVVDMSKLVQTTIHELGAPWMDRRVEVRLRDLPPCKGEPALLKQVWVNLLSNALKYSRKRDLAVIEIGGEMQNGESVYFVKDNGSGFDMRYAGALFGVFQRLHRAEEFEGTGVGLAIVQRIVQRHGGRVWAEAELEVGATFFFTLEKEVKA